MFGKKKRAPMPKGQGAAAAKQMGLFVDLSPEEMLMGMDDNLDDPSLEAELAAITGDNPPAGGRAKQKRKAPLPMEDIARMADDCMKDLDEDDDDDDVNLEDDEDLLAELQEVVGEEDTEDVVMADSTSSAAAESSPANTPGSPSTQESTLSAAPGSLQHTLEERRAMYKTALENAKAAGESSKVRRFDRGLKTLETMVAAVKKGRSVNEAEIPPPVSTGAPQSQPPVPPLAAAPQSQPPLPPLAAAPQSKPPVPPRPAPPRPAAAEPSKEEECSSSSAALSTVSSLPSPAAEAERPPGKYHVERLTFLLMEVDEATMTMLLERQKEYKMAALRAKKQGDVEQAKLHVRTSKKFDAVIEALGKGAAVDLSGLPPPPQLGEGGSSAPAKESPVAQPSAAEPAQPAQPAQAAGPAPPRDVLEALEQRRAKYAEASAQAKASGDDRKARMHDRIAKQYQSAIRVHKAGKPVNFEELPTPPGFPPIPGQKGAGADQGLAAALEAANKLATTDAAEGDEDGEEENEEDKPSPNKPSPNKPTLAVPPTVQTQQKRSSASSPDRESAKEGISPTGTQQLDFLEGRRKQYMKAALQAKQKADMEQAKGFLRTAKSLEPLIEAARGGKAVDISKVPSPPGDEDEDFILVHHSDVQLSEKAEAVYTQLVKILKEQHEKCLTYSKQFTHLGNVTETTKFEKMAESCKQNLEILKLSQARGLDPPKHHFEERTHRTVRLWTRIFPELSSTEMVVEMVRGLNLPAPSGIQPNDLDAYVKFDFPYPSTEKPQSHKTAVIKNTNCPEYNQSFTLTINRKHRGFRRVLQTKGLKLEVLHKGGFLRSDKPVGSAILKLEQLESHSEIREIVEVMDGRKHTGGRIEVKVRLREPISGQDLQSVTERWLVLDQSQVNPHLKVHPPLTCFSQRNSRIAASGEEEEEEEEEGVEACEEEGETGGKKARDSPRGQS
ncbi:Coiled-coil and C2 domain-containing protein 1B [Merluccius polli]|uniref:Coiled-coil and C2 domain-containing protein 1B n=1 Tax=Merluccius polli TaxID=89951 RepID=A0AA47NQI7_MERPO|nr:Coiled-coil and C2 domain-containing protein 1B [Merluccius polli]